MLTLAAALTGRPAEADEPFYRGRSLTAWLNDLWSDPSPAPSGPAVEALRAIGSAAVPTLLAELQSLPAPALEAPPAPVPDGQRRWRAFQTLQLIGQPACTSESAAALANIAVGTDLPLATRALETLASWGAAASNAIPPILHRLNAQTAAGGPSLSAAHPPSPPYVWTLARIGSDSKDVLLALLADRGPNLHFTLSHWCEPSKSGLKLMREAVCDPAVPSASRIAAISFLNVRRDTNLLAAVPKLLKELELRGALTAYLDRQSTNALPLCPLLLEAAAQVWAEKDGQSAQGIFRAVARSGRSDPQQVIPLLLPLTFDERFPINCAIPADVIAPLWADARLALEELMDDRDKLASLLAGYLVHSNWRLRNAAAARLWGMGRLDAEAIANLKTCLSDTNELVRLSAAVTLARRPEFRERVMDQLLASIDSGTLSLDLRIHALHQLWQRRPAGKEIARALPVLQRAQKNPDTRIQQLASRVLASLEPSEP
jgi:hypothetical protein